MADTPGPRGTKRFDVIDVRDDTVPWGNREGYPTYLRVWLQDVTEAEAMFLVRPEGDPATGLDFDTGLPIGNLTARAYHILESRINPPTLAQIEAAWMVSGEYVIVDGQGMLAWVEKKIDNSTPPAWGTQ
jgi:hypothetical protein